MFRMAIIATLLAIFVMPALGNDAMDCSIGEVEKTFGGTRWFVYGCSDGKSVVVLAAPGNPANPFYFIIFPEGDDYRLYGEGTGDRAATKPAYDELSASLSPEFVAALFSEAAASVANPGADNGT